MSIIHATLSTQHGLFLRPNVKVKNSLHRPLTGLEGSKTLRWQISRKWTYENGKAVSPKHRPPLPHEIFVVLISVTDRVDARTISGRKDYVNKQFQ